MSNEIITVAQMRAIDAASAEAGMPTRTLMQRAGEAVAAAVREMRPSGSIAVLCGPGANGGDGWVAARALKRDGFDVSVWSLVPRDALTGDAADAAAAWDGSVALLDESVRADLYIDALFGAGLSRPLDGVAARVAAMLPAERVIAVDVPSGVDGDSGRVLGEVSAKAHKTVTFVRKKPAHVLYPGRALCGAVIVADIGAPEAVVAAQGVTLFENAPVLWRDAFPWPSAEAHKHRRGHVMVASGGFAQTGAARLSARGALRVGAGLVTVLSPPEALAVNAAHLMAIMLRKVADADALVAALGEATAAVIGPAFGVSEAHGEKLRAVLAMEKRPHLLLDADALTLLAKQGLGALQPGDVLTPHLGEFKRVFPDIDASARIEAAREAARRANAIVLLKGPDTVIASPDGRAVINTSGTPYLATAGSGDVLAGFIAGLIGQGMGSFDAACAGAWLHGRAAEALGPGLIAEDLPEVLPRVLRDLSE